MSEKMTKFSRSVNSGWGSLTKKLDERNFGQNCSLVNMLRILAYGIDFFYRKSMCKQVTRLSETYRLSKRRLLYYIWRSTSGGLACKSNFSNAPSKLRGYSHIVSLTINTWTIQRTRDKPHRLIKWFIQNWTRSNYIVKSKKLEATVFLSLSHTKYTIPNLKRRVTFNSIL